MLLQPPGATELVTARAPFFVLRRYSQFRQLFNDLRAALPEAMRHPALQPPPKHAFHLGATKELLDRRRAELERWLWRLIAAPEVARSAVRAISGAENCGFTYGFLGFHVHGSGDRST